ncbi:hypothetical protein LWC34_02400 [Kibdelosporangium philippinense]|uniref:Integral membrane protein n=1 Tax=Kibdelosporangium philippinense TaxID=211113 RepID=A0ABS8Z2N0_9PSEU|nr:hypothetical protein [Kibdelosporangium philippinense]MCE7001697.1 hypothetical protein [Kibdelosporangium philippinense]
MADVLWVLLWTGVAAVACVLITVVVVGYRSRNSNNWAKATPAYLALYLALPLMGVGGVAGLVLAVGWAEGVGDGSFAACVGILLLFPVFVVVDSRLPR